VEATTEVILTQYVIYERPKDYPDSFVVRCWDIKRGADAPIPHAVGCLCASLEEARDQVPVGHVNIGRMAEDEPQIVEVWT
jgi:hypothetical protein